jgi:hypothetical protein
MTQNTPSYPPAVNPAKVGTYPMEAFSGGGYFYDQVLEYRVWIKSKCSSFATYEEALDFAKKKRNADEPVVLIYQKEYINEPEENVFEHIKKERVSEWLPEWLEGSERGPNSIADFLKEHQK